MPIEVNMAKLSPTMESGQMVKWLVKVGDKVKEGDTLAEIQTDKAVMPMEAFDEGTVARLDVAEGEDIALGQRVLVLAQKGEDLKAVAAQFEGKKVAAGAAKPAEAKARPEQETTNVPTRPEERGAEANGQEAHAVAAEPELVAQAAGGRVKSSPLARKVAAASSVDLTRVTGTGPGGRVIRKDVEAYLEKKPAAPAARPAAASAPRPGGTQRIPHTPARKTIARRMLESKQSAPEIHVVVDVRVDELVAIRERLNKPLAAEKIKLSLGDFVTKAVALALRRHPGVNASFEPDAMVLHGDVNLGIAVALDGSLIVPVLANADTLGLRDIRIKTDELVQAARQSKLKPAQMMGGTFTISNLGMYGVRQFDAILNLPEVAILAVGAAERRAVVEGDKLVPGTVMTLTLTVDHRAVDGAMAAEFLRTLKGLLEEPASMLL